MKIKGVNLVVINGGTPANGSAGKPGGNYQLTSMSRFILTLGQKDRQSKLMHQAMGLKPALYAATKAAQLIELAGKDLAALFQPDLILVATGPLPDQPVLEKLSALAQKERRLIYLPDMLATSAVVSGQTALDAGELFSANIQTLGLSGADLSPTKFGSLVVAPLVTGLHREQPTLHGSLILGWNKQTALDPIVDLLPLLVYADYLGVALSHAS